MTAEECETLGKAIDHHNEMVRLYQKVCLMRERGDDPRQTPAASEAIGLALKVDPLRKALAAFTVREMDAGNMGPYHTAIELLSTMRTLISTIDGATLRHVPMEIQPDGIPEQFRASYGQRP